MMSSLVPDNANRGIKVFFKNKLKLFFNIIKVLQTILKVMLIILPFGCISMMFILYYYIFTIFLTEGPRLLYKCPGPS